MHAYIPSTVNVRILWIRRFPQRATATTAARGGATSSGQCRAHRAPFCVPRRSAMGAVCASKRMAALIASDMIQFLDTSKVGSIRVLDQMR